MTLMMTIIYDALMLIDDGIGERGKGEGGRRGLMKRWLSYYRCGHFDDPGEVDGWYNER